MSANLLNALVASRRSFLSGTATLGSAWMLGCNPGERGKGPATGGDDTGETVDTDDTGDTGAGADCEDLTEGGELESVMAWLDETPRDLETRTGEGLDGRFVVDLTSLLQADLEVPNDRFFIRSFPPTGIDTDGPWSVTFGGLVEDELEISAEDLVAESTDMGLMLVECSGNTDYGGFGLMSACVWDGVLLSELLDRVTPTSGTALVKVTGFDDHGGIPSGSTEGAEWVFTQDQIAASGAFLATGMNGATLPLDHGWPVRLLMPNWYGCTCIKWVTNVTLVSEDEGATSQMREFAGRVHQEGSPSLARDYAAAEIDLAAVPIRVEKWRLEDGSVAWVVAGLVWGGEATQDGLQIRFLPDGDDDATWEDVHVCPERPDHRTWAIWEHRWRPEAAGRFELRLRLSDESVRTRRLDSGWYARTVELDEV